MDIHHPQEPSDILGDAVDLESNFYSSGYQDGYDHGRLHGLFEGREIGKEKAYEIWEEVGYYEGWAMSHLASGAGVKGKQARAANHAKVLIDLIGTFPTDNPSDTPAQTEGPETEVDLTALLSNIRARYKLLCASLGVRPRLVAASTSAGTQDSTATADGQGQGQVVEGVEGPIKGVDTSKLRF